MSLKQKLSEKQVTIGSWITLGQKQVTIGSWITLGHPSIAEIMAKAGYDWLTVDMEHSAITLHQTQQLIQVIELSGCAPLVRVGENDPVIVPMVNTKEEAEKAVASVKYPPKGFRGVGLARAQKYGADFEGYKDWNNTESIVVVQIEHIKAVENLEAILSVDGVDAFIIGPYDLSGSLGVPGQFDHPDMLAALARIKEVSHNLKAVSGFHVIPPDVVALKNKVREGYKFIAHSLDILFLGNNCKEALKIIRSEL